MILEGKKEAAERESLEKRQDGSDERGELQGCDDYQCGKKRGGGLVLGMKMKIEGEPLIYCHFGLQRSD